MLTQAYYFYCSRGRKFTTREGSSLKVLDAFELAVQAAQCRANGYAEARTQLLLEIEQMIDKPAEVRAIVAEAETAVLGTSDSL